MASGRSRTSLSEGLFEHLVTEDLRGQLAGVPSNLTADFERLDDTDAHEVVARHLAREISRALDTLPKKNRADLVRSVATRILDRVGELFDDETAAALQAERPVEPAQRLLALHRGVVPDRPHTPLGTSTLLTRARSDPGIGHELEREIASADRIDALVAFVTVGGVRALQRRLVEFSRKPSARLRLLTTTFTGTTEPAALDALARLPGVEVKVSYDTRRTRLHAKAWLFHRDNGLSTAYVGSANLTSTALGAGHEWMVKVAAADLPHVIQKFDGTFQTLWTDPEFEPYRPDVEEDRVRLKRALAVEAHDDATDRFLVTLRPFPFQVEILDKLATERALHGRRRNLVVAATGTGKTVIAAFDYHRQMGATQVPPRLLFLAHREELLEQARRTFRYVLQDASFGELLVGGREPQRYDHVFATIQSAASHGLVERFGPDHFRHVIVDECHHVPAASYRAIVPALRPDLLVGLTATPERTDGKSLLPDFDGHIAAELRLWHALDDQLLVPFDYYGIADGTDLRRVRWSRAGYDAGALGELYTGDHARADLVRHQLARRVSEVRKIRALGFCVSVAHAEFMAECFRRAGIPALAIHGDTDAEVRSDAPRQLREREVNVLFTCDLYNEGVDLPFVDTLLLLRPTQSATVFLQQLGRGLRHFQGPPAKTSCLVLDFIGQHRSEYRFDAVLSALTSVPRARLTSSVEDDFPYLPSGCSLQLDAHAKEVVLRSLRASLGGARRLAADLKELAQLGPRPRLAQFLEATSRELEEVYHAGGWTTVQREAGLAETTEEVDDLSRRLGWLGHVDEPARLRTYRDALAQTARGELASLDATDRLRIQMLDFQLEHRGVMRAAEATLQYLAGYGPIVAELEELREVLEDRSAHPSALMPVADWPLALHHHYSRREIAAAVGYIQPGKPKNVPQSGILKLDESRRELLFVTLDKSGRTFSPTTRYRDYALSPDTFHWETQTAASASRPSGQRYLASTTNGWSFYLFVRADPDAAYAFLGPAKYESHTGDRPIAITWRLEHPMSAALFALFATLRA